MTTIQYSPLNLSSYWLLVIGYQLHKHLKMCLLSENITLFISTYKRTSARICFQAALKKGILGTV